MDTTVIGFQSPRFGLLRCTTCGDPDFGKPVTLFDLFFGDECCDKCGKALYVEPDPDDGDIPVGCGICDGIHGNLCPIESPDPDYYADEMRAGR